MIVRGAPAIGIAGAHGVALAAIEAKKSIQNRKDFDKIIKAIKTDLFWFKQIIISKTVSQRIYDRKHNKEER